MTGRLAGLPEANAIAAIDSADRAIETACVPLLVAAAAVG